MTTEATYSRQGSCAPSSVRVGTVEPLWPEIGLLQTEAPLSGLLSSAVCAVRTIFVRMCSSFRSPIEAPVWAQGTPPRPRREPLRRARLPVQIGESLAQFKSAIQGRIGTSTAGI